MSRNPTRDMLKSYGAFETHVTLVEHALTSNKSKIKKFVDMKNKLEAAYLKFDEDFREHKGNVIKDKTIEEFNGVTPDEKGIEVPNYPENDAWSKSKMLLYIATSEKLEEKIDAMESSVEEVKPSKVEDDNDQQVSLLSEINSELDSIQNSVSTFSAEVDKLEEISVSKASALERFAEKISVKIQATRQMAMKIEENERLSVIEKFNTEAAKINSIILQLCSKVKDQDFLPNNVNVASTKANDHERVHLEKSKPPKFKGDIIDYPEFKRSWQNIVGKAKLPEVAEIERLKECIPNDAKEQLYAIETVNEAWEILDKRYGDSNLIAKKLKGQLKSIQPEGRSAPQIIISLHVKVRTIVTKLESLKMSEALKHDSEFLSAVYCALPDRHKTRWLEYEKSSNHWETMMRFLETAYNQANEELALLATYDADNKKPLKPDKTPVKPFAIRGKKGEIENSDSDEDSPKDKARKRAQQFCGKCPVCNKDHTWVRKSGDKWPSDRFISCKKFQDMTVDVRASSVQKCKGCPRCLSWNHGRNDCKMPANSCNKDLGNGTKCKGDHSKLLCGSGNPYCAAVFSQPQSVVMHSISTSLDPDAEDKDRPNAADLKIVDESVECVFYLQDIPVENTEERARVFWDEGSNRIFIRHEYARIHNLKKKKVLFSYEVVDHQPEVKHGYIYWVTLLDMYGKPHRIWGYGVERIMTSSVPDMSLLQSRFPHVPGTAFQPCEEREVDILVGLIKSAISPAGGLGNDRVKGMKALRSQFGNGWVIGGALDEAMNSSNYTAPSISSQVLAARCSKILVKPEPGLTPDFWESDQLGVKLPARCDRCKNCLQSGECSDAHATHTAKEQAELELIKSKVKLVDGQIYCDYPFIKDPSCLSNNRASAVAVAEKVWRGLKKDNLLSTYNEQVQQILDRGAAVKLSKQEMEEYVGPVQYISHHGVLKDSVSTPCRMVTNSSFNNCGRSLNSCLATGPNSLNPMLDVLLRFRCRDCAFQYDMSKAYNTMKTGIVERHLRRFVWRFREEDLWEDFAFDCVHFGDRCAACQLEVSKDLIADENKQIDYEAAQRIKDDVYVDDGLSGGSEEQVHRFVGDKLADGSFSGTIPQILKRGGFKLKAIVKSGENDMAEIEKMGTSVFGYNWDAPSDTMSVKFPVNLSKKKRSVRSEPNLSVGDIPKLGAVKLTKRILLGFLHGFCDPLGIASPWYMKLKVLMKELYELEAPLGWDDVIPVSNKEKWVAVMTEALLEGTLPFPRSTRPKNAVGTGPLIVTFADGGKAGFGGNIYLQWQVKCVHEYECEGKGDYQSNLCLSKCRVCPLRGYTIPRCELCGALLMSRMLLSVARALAKLDEKPVGAVPLLDSRCVISALEVTSGHLLPFFQNRLAEIHENFLAVSKFCPVEPVQWVPSKLNPSDLLTRGNINLRDLGPTSYHQLGPEFLCWPRESWPVTRDFVRTELPEKEVRYRDHVFYNAVARSNFVFADPSPVAKNPFNMVESIANYSDSLKKVHNILARAMRSWRKAGRDMEMKITNPLALTMIAVEPSGDEVNTAREILLLHAMPSTIEAFNAGRLTSLLPVRNGKLIVTTGRLGEKSLERLLGVKCLPILMNDTRVAYLYMVLAHEKESGLSNLSVEHHRGVVGTLARSCTYVWIVKGRSLAKKVVSKCVVCRRERKLLESQQMGVLKEQHLTVCPPWTYVSLDFCGPVQVCGEVEKRKAMKCWILVYVDQSSRAISLLLAPGYSTADFLLKHDYFTTQRGIPKKIVSDRGTQLVAGSIAVANKDLPGQAYDWDRVVRENKCSTWEFVPVGCQFRNQTEAIVKILKKALLHALPLGSRLTYSEMETVLGRVEYSVNSRPLALATVSSTSQQEDFLQPLTPNQLQLGRNTAEVPAMDYDPSNKFSARLAYVENVHKHWWDQWIIEVLPTLIPVRKWKNPAKNLQVNDIVMMLYKGNLVDDYRLAKVTEIFPDDKGLVRTVKVSYSKRDKREPYNVYRSKGLVSEIIAVQRLSLLQAADENLVDKESES